MGGAFRRWTYRVKQFAWAVSAQWRKPTPAALNAARVTLPDAGWRMFRQMPAADQTHALKVLADLRSAGYDDRALAQAALLHDVAKRSGGVTLLHRVAVVLLKAFAPRTWMRIKARPEPARNSLVYPLWAHANHPATGAAQAAAAGCLPDAVDLIRRHQDPLPPADQRPPQDARLAALQKADDDN